MKTMETEQLFSDIIAYYALYLTEYHMHMHAHPQCEIMYVINGACDIVMNDRTCTLHKNQFIFLDANYPHMLRITDTEPCSILNLEFSIRSGSGDISLQEIKKESPQFSEFLSNKESVFVGTDSENLGYALKDLIAHLKAAPVKGQYGYLEKILFYRVLLELSACYCKNKLAPGVIYLRKACDYINTHLTEELRVPDIAAFVGINKSYLHSLFSRHMDCTISAYINNCRLELAAFLLSNSSLSVTDIAFQSGYNSRQHFAATFEKFYGVSPRSYRQLHQKDLEASTGVSQMYRMDDGNWSESVMSIK